MSNLLQQTQLNVTTISLNSTSMFLSLGLLSHARQFGTLQAITVHHLLLNFSMFQSLHLLKKRNNYGVQRTILDKHAPPPLQKN